MAIGFASQALLVPIVLEGSLSSGGIDTTTPRRSRPSTDRQVPPLFAESKAHGTAHAVSWNCDYNHDFNSLCDRFDGSPLHHHAQGWRRSLRPRPRVLQEDLSGLPKARGEQDGTASMRAP